MGSGGCISAMYLDFAKVFDRVPHQRLTKKLTAYGVQGEVSMWVEAFIAGRRQRVLVNGSPTESSEVTSGIPGEVSSAPLF